MRHSTDRILTTHTGSLPRPRELARALGRRWLGRLDLAEAPRLCDRVRDAVADVVRRQTDAGVDVVSDGEMNKVAFSAYVTERLTGFAGDQSSYTFADLVDYPAVAKRVGIPDGRAGGLPSCVEPVTYVGGQAVKQDLANLRAALEGAEVTEAFIPAVSPGVISYSMQNRYYGSEDDYLAALAEAMREEYGAIANAGFLLQVDCPDLAASRHLNYADLDLKQFRARITAHVEALNEALRTIPPERVRLHVCWANYAGPHHRDVALRDIIDIVLRARAHAIVLEAANPRHGHEWRVFEDVALPEDKILIPGVIDTTTNYIEHPELVAERITRYAELVGRERVIAGTDCGFGTAITYETVAPELVWPKLATLSEGARLATQRLW